MSYSIGLYFDIATERRIRSLWQEMAEKGVSDYLPGQCISHSAIVMEIDSQNVQTGMDLSRKQLELPLKAQIEEIDLIEFRPVKHLFCYRIGG